MRNSALFAEHAMLTERLVPSTDIKKSWTTLKRKGIRVRPDVLRYLRKNTTGKFAMGHKYIAFENADDALVYKIAYPT